MTVVYEKVFDVVPQYLEFNASSTIIFALNLPSGVYDRLRTIPDVTKVLSDENIAQIVQGVETAFEVSSSVGTGSSRRYVDYILNMALSGMLLTLTVNISAHDAGDNVDWTKDGLNPPLLSSYPGITPNIVGKYYI